MNTIPVDEISATDWINDVVANERENVRGLFSKATSIEEKVRVLKEWHPKGYINLKPVGTLEQFFKYVRLAATESTWFRGESMDHGRLIPRLYRNMGKHTVTQLQDKERKYYLEFRRRARALAPMIDPNDKWSWYFLMQHYGGPTRLLDWTQDAATALFFALDTDRDSTTHPIVILLHPAVLTDYAYKEIGEEKITSGTILYPGESPSEKWIANIVAEPNRPIEPMPHCPIPLLPPYSDPRITAQRSSFTLFGQDIDGFHKDGAHIVCPTCGSRIICRLVINGNEKLKLRAELARIGTSSGKVYPGLDGLSKELTEEFFGKE